MRSPRRSHASPLQQAAPLGVLRVRTQSHEVGRLRLAAVTGTASKARHVACVTVRPLVARWRPAVCADPARFPRPPCVGVGGPRRESGAEHRGPRFPSLEASRPDRALRRGAGFSAATCAHARGGAAGPRRVCWHARSRWRREGKGTAARRVFSGATPPGTCGRIFAFPGVWRGRGEQRPRR